MTTPEPSDFVASLIEKLDQLSRIGANALRAVAIVDGLAVVAFWVVVARAWDIGGIVLAVVGLLPAAFLWWYARALDAAVRRARIEIGVRQLLTRTTQSVGEVLEARRLRFGLIRAGWRALRSIRALRSDVERLGLDLTAWATVSNPASLLAAGVSVAACAAITVVSGLAVVLVIVL